MRREWFVKLLVGMCEFMINKFDLMKICEGCFRHAIVARRIAADLSTAEKAEAKRRCAKGPGRPSARLVDYYPSTDPMQGPIVHQPAGRMWDTKWRGRRAGY